MKGLLAVILFSLLISISECEVSERAKRLAEKLIKFKKFHNFLKARKLQTDESNEQKDVIPANQNKRAAIQFLDINGYNLRSSSGNHKSFTFNIFFYFLNMAIPSRVFVPLKLTLGRLRSLEDRSIESTCTPSGEATDKDVLGGQSQRFECTGDVETSSDIKGLSISANDPVTAQGSDGKNATVTTDDINFSEDASKAASSIESAKDNVNKVVILQNGIIASQNKDQFTIAGNLVDDVKDGDPLTLDLYDELTISNKKILCSVKRNSGQAVEVNCDTNGENLKAGLNFKSGMDGSTKVFLNMTDENAIIEINDANSTTPSGNNVVYRKNSSGLSGGAIAGIVIACVVALIAASIAALMLRKPTVTPPIDNTTAVQLRSVDNL